MTKLEPGDLIQDASGCIKEIAPGETQSPLGARLMKRQLWKDRFSVSPGTPGFIVMLRNFRLDREECIKNSLTVKKRKITPTEAAPKKKSPSRKKAPLVTMSELEIQLELEALSETHSEDDLLFLERLMREGKYSKEG